MQYEKELLEEMWRKMNLSREFEERVQWLFSMGLVHGGDCRRFNPGIKAGRLCVRDTQGA